MRFSQRIGVTPVKVDLQIESMDNDLRTGLWNVFKILYIDSSPPSYNDQLNQSELHRLFSLLWLDHFKLPLDSLPIWYREASKHVREGFLKNWSWYEVYDFLEFVVKKDKTLSRSESLTNACNRMLERELSAYRFVNQELVQITDKVEIKEVEEAINTAHPKGLQGVNVHLSTALQMLADKRNPDYRNSIKESISAVESIAQVMSGDPKATLGNALKLIEEKIGIHKALKSGLSSIYGYTSDAEGIRHAMLEEREIHFEDAKYMLVSCSAFINYLIVKSDRAGIPLN